MTFQFQFLAVLYAEHRSAVSAPDLLPAYFCPRIRRRWISISVSLYSARKKKAASEITSGEEGISRDLWGRGTRVAICQGNCNARETGLVMQLTKVNYFFFFLFCEDGKTRPRIVLPPRERPPQSFIQLRISSRDDACQRFSPLSSIFSSFTNFLSFLPLSSPFSSRAPTSKGKTVGCDRNWSGKKKSGRDTCDSVMRGR